MVWAHNAHEKGYIARKVISIKVDRYTGRGCINSKLEKDEYADCSSIRSIYVLYWDKKVER